MSSLIGNLQEYCFLQNGGKVEYSNVKTSKSLLTFFVVKENEIKLLTQSLVQLFINKKLQYVCSDSALIDVCFLLVGIYAQNDRHSS